MNDKFFDIRKEKQDRILNAVLKIFALNGYKRACTDEMVKEAGISKGLLFHYFTTKAGMYEFVYRYSVKYMTMELSGVQLEGETDYFLLKEKIEEVKRTVAKNFHYMPLFLERADREADSDLDAGMAEEIAAIRQEYLELLGGMEEKTDFSAYPSYAEREKIYVLTNQLLRTLWEEERQKDAAGYLRMLRQMCEK